MGRWTQYDEDEYRLPEGMTRVGYDASTGRYTFQDADGSQYQGSEGSTFGEMTRISEGPSNSAGASEVEDEDVEAQPSGIPRRSDGYQPLAIDTPKHHTLTSPYRSLFPFFLLIAVILLLVWRLILAPGLSYQEKQCPGNGKAYLVQPGDSCWEISRVHNCKWEEFQEMNRAVNCETLMPGTMMCVPGPTSATGL